MARGRPTCLSVPADFLEPMKTHRLIVARDTIGIIPLCWGGVGILSMTAREQRLSRICCVWLREVLFLACGTCHVPHCSPTWPISRMPLPPQHRGYGRDGSVWIASEMKCLTEHCERCARIFRGRLWPTYPAVRSAHVPGSDRARGTLCHYQVIR